MVRWDCIGIGSGHIVFCASWKLFFPPSLHGYSKCPIRNISNAYIASDVFLYPWKLSVFKKILAYFLCIVLPTPLDKLLICLGYFHSCLSLDSVKQGHIEINMIKSKIVLSWWWRASQCGRATWQDYKCKNKFELFQNVVWPLGMALLRERNKLRFSMTSQRVNRWLRCNHRALNKREVNFMLTRPLFIWQLKLAPPSWFTTIYANMPLKPHDLFVSACDKTTI